MEWGDFPSVRSIVRPFVRTSPPLGHPARPEAQPARPEAQPAIPEAKIAKLPGDPWGLGVLGPGGPWGLEALAHWARNGQYPDIVFTRFYPYFHYFAS